MDREMRLSLDLLCRQEYAAARAGFETLFKEEPIARDYWVGAVQMARYEDWGDTLALAEAESGWSRIREVECSDTDSACGTLQALSALQLSYIQRMRGHPLQSARTALWAQSRLEKDSTAEGKMAYALLRYYRSILLEKLSWLPFVDPDVGALIGQMEAALEESRWFGPLLAPSLFWVYYDRGPHSKGLAWTESYLSEYPDHRIVTSMQADMALKMGEKQKALALYRGLHRVYSRSDEIDSLGLPLGRLKAEGNLARIFHRLGKQDSADFYLEKWEKAWSDPRLRPHLPESLHKALQAR